jgi:hypothetical protein
MKINMEIKLIFVTAFLGFTNMMVSCQREEPKHNESDKIIVYLQLSAPLAHPEPQNYALKDKMEIAYLPVKNVEKNPEWQSVNAIAYNGYVKWTLYSNEPVKMKYGFGSLPIVSPGDSIVIHYDGEKFQYLGKGTDKLTCWNEMLHIGKEIPTPTVSNNHIKSLNDYNEWMSYLDNNITQQISLIDSYKNKIDPFEYEYLKVAAIGQMESSRIQLFRTLRSYCKKDSNTRISLADLNAIWDSTQYHPLNAWQKAIANYYGDIYGVSEFNKQEVWRQFSFNANNDSLKAIGLRNYLYYTHAKQQYKGILRERLLTQIMEEQTKTSFKDPITQTMLKDYYSQPGFPEYKKQVKELEGKIAEKLAKK